MKPHEKLNVSNNMNKAKHASTYEYPQKHWVFLSLIRVNNVFPFSFFLSWLMIGQINSNKMGNKILDLDNIIWAAYNYILHAMHTRALNSNSIWISDCE